MAKSLEQRLEELDARRDALKRQMCERDKRTPAFREAGAARNAPAVRATQGRLIPSGGCRECATRGAKRRSGTWSEHCDRHVAGRRVTMAERTDSDER